MPLRSFLSHLDHDPQATRLADEGGAAFVSQALRPFLLAALADRDVRRPTVVVAALAEPVVLEYVRLNILARRPF